MISSVLYSLIILFNLLHIVYSSLPISYPNAATANKGSAPYNLIDTDPSCFYQGTCPMFPPGGKLSAFPNSEEKYQQILHNLHRMFPNNTRATPMGKYTYGANTGGGTLNYCKSGCVYCGTYHPDRAPLYWYSDANQAARFKQWDENTCDQAWYDEVGQNAHSTCAWGLSSISMWGSGNTYSTGTNRCNLLSNTGDNDYDCEFGRRSSGFCHDEKDNCWFETEGICGGNSCLNDPHCEPIFANKYDFVGKGFVEGMNGVGAVYSRYTKEIFYPLPIGTHFYERIHIASADRDANGKQFVLALEYFDHNKTQTPTNCWALYDGAYHELDVYVSTDGPSGTSWTRGTYGKNAYNLFFYNNFDLPTSCQPYAFICKTSLNNYFRLPEETEYYFGTEWIDWYWTDRDNIYSGAGLECKENHYYYSSTESKWIVNGGPSLSSSDIWYYHEGNSCIGCQYISILDCWQDCIYNNFVNCNCGAPTTPTTPAPTTPAPTTPSPTTPAPTTPAPTTPDPTTPAPTTPAPTTPSPTTPEPTRRPRTPAPTTPTPTTPAPTTPAPTTPAPTTPAPTTPAPTTPSPTTSAPTTAAPTTAAPTTSQPTAQTSAPTKTPTSDPTKDPTSDPTSNPTTRAPTGATDGPTTDPTSATAAPSQAPSAYGLTCESMIDWDHRWNRVREWDEASRGPTYLAQAEEMFLDERPECGDWNGDSLEYYYYFEWGGKTQPNRHKLDIYMHVCCGSVGVTFGPNYELPPEYGTNYQQNSVLHNKYSANTLEKDDSWTDAEQFGAKQYIVFTIIALVGCGCCVAAIYGVYYMKNKRGDTHQNRVNLENTYSNELGKKSRGSKRVLPGVQMHGMSSYPGPKHVVLPSYGNDSTNGSTDGDNKYQGRFIHHHDSTDNSENGLTQPRGMSPNLVPPPAPFNPLGRGHGHVPSSSFESPQFQAIADNLDLNPPPTFSGLPPPQTSDDPVHQLDAEDINNAFQ